MDYIILICSTTCHLYIFTPPNDRHFRKKEMDATQSSFIWGKLLTLNQFGIRAVFRADLKARNQ